MKRRDMLTGAMGIAGAALLSEKPGLAAPSRKRVLRVGHLTDIHVQPEKNAGEGMAKAIAHAQNQKSKPDFLLFGGDQVFDAFGVGYDRAKTLWELFDKILKDNTNLPVEQIIGNHDVTPLLSNGSRMNEGDKNYAKLWAMERMGLTSPYRTFDKKGWRFIVLDSTLVQGKGYIAKLDEPQFEWLEATLKATPPTMPTMIVSHIPILGVTSFFDGDNAKTGSWVIPGSWMHIDAKRLKDLFVKYPCVKVCLSGHEHLVDSVTYLGVTYMCNGAVCGGWWDGNYHETPPGYALMDLYDDGTFKRQYIEWGWKKEA